MPKPFTFADLSETQVEQGEESTNRGVSLSSIGNENEFRVVPEKGLTPNEQMDCVDSHKNRRSMYYIL